MMDNIPPLLEARALATGYDDGPEVIAEIEVSCRPGTITALIGPNGCGKSTLLKTLAGLLPARRGEVILQGRELKAWPEDERARTIGYLPQQPRCHWPITVERLAALGRLPHLPPWSRPSAVDEIAVTRALEQSDLILLRERPLHELSGGEAMRAHMARVLAGTPSVILADEPMAALDLRHQLEMLQLIQRLAREQKTSWLVVLHDLSMAARLADSLVLMQAGRIVASGSPPEVLTPDHLRLIYGVEARLQWEPAPPAVVPVRKSDSPAEGA